MKVNYTLVHSIAHLLHLLIIGDKVIFTEATTELRLTDDRFVWRHWLIDVFGHGISAANGRQNHINFIQLVIDEVYSTHNSQYFKDIEIYDPVRALCLELEKDLQDVLEKRITGIKTISGAYIQERLMKWLTDMAQVNKKENNHGQES